MNKLGRPHITNATYQVPRSQAFWFWRRRFLKGFYHIWAWWPSWSCDQNILYKFWLNYHKESSHEIWVQLVQWFVRKLCFNILMGLQYEQLSWKVKGLPREHSAIVLTFVKLPFFFKTSVLSIFEWPLKTGFTVVWLNFKLFNPFPAIRDNCCLLFFAYILWWRILQTIWAHFRLLSDQGS